MDDDNFTGFLALFIIMLTISAIAYVPFSAFMEAKQFNKFSKTKITWWDALWADYRIVPDK